MHLIFNPQPILHHPSNSALTVEEEKCLWGEGEEGCEEGLWKINGDGKNKTKEKQQK